MSQNKGLWKIIGASSLGTLIEWYDFYIFGSLATEISSHFFPKGNEFASLLATLSLFAAGFVVRPFGALVFGRLGDLVGRKHTFLLTLLLMGGATFLIGCVPSYETIGAAAPIIVLLLRLVQGLALGGEYGGAATYVAEHAPAHQRGYWTSWIQTTATAGLFLSLMVILITRNSLGKTDFENFGWRIPFWVSILLVVVSYFIRKNMHESPLFEKAKQEGTIAANPLKESFGKKANLKFVLLALFGLVMGQGVIWYTGQFYALSFIKKTMQLESEQTDVIVGTALLAATPFFVFFGWLSDKIGRKKVMLFGMLIALLSYRSIYKEMYSLTDESKRKQSIYCVYPNDTKYSLEAGDKHTISYSGDLKVTLEAKKEGNTIAWKKKSVSLNKSDQLYLGFLLFIQVLFVTMVYGPIAAFLVEMFPVNIRYTSMSLPYHIGNGIFGGLLPMIATYLVNQGKENKTADFYLEGLWYPILICGVCFVIGILFLRDKQTFKQEES